MYMLINAIVYVIHTNANVIYKNKMSFLIIKKNN